MTSADGQLTHNNEVCRCEARNDLVFHRPDCEFLNALMLIAEEMVNK